MIKGLVKIWNLLVSLHVFQTICCFYDQGDNFLAKTDSSLSIFYSGKSTPKKLECDNRS